MAEMKTKDGGLTTAELAKFGILPNQTDRPRLVKGHASQTQDGGVALLEVTPLFSELETGDFRSQWNKLQTGLVNEPRRTVEDANKLMASVMRRLADGFAEQLSGLETQWERGGDAAPEDLRIALQQYHSFFDRLLQLQRDEHHSEA